MKQIFFLLVILFLQISYSAIVIEGKVYSASDEIPDLAHAHIAQFGESYYSPLQTVQVDKKGYFNFEIEEDAFYSLYVTAADHEGYYIPLITDSKKIKLNIRLKANEFKPVFDSAKIIGNWNGFRVRNAEDMEKQADGTFIYKLKSDSAIISYQLVDITENGHTVNGTLHDELEYDGGGDYISHIKNPGGEVYIIFDPKKLSRNSEQFDPLKIYGDPTLLEITKINNKINDFETGYEKLRDAYIQQNKSEAGFKYDFDEISAYLMQRLQSKDELIKRFAAIKFVATMEKGNNVDAIKITEILPLSDPLWVSDGFMVTEVFEKAYGDKKAEEIINTQFETIKSQSVRAKILLSFGLEAKQNGDLKKVTELHKNLSDNYTALNSQRWFQWYLSQINPDKAIFKGKQVPDFEIKNLHSDQTISNKSLLGTYYMIDFWAVWCGPCRTEMPNLHEVFNEFKDSKFTILSLSFDPKIEDVDKYRREEWEMPWLHAFVENGFNNDLSKRFEVTGIPKPILVDLNGKIIATDIELRGENLKKTLQKFINSNF
jgi:thiol-disulfide isomerase/thioredoxin